MYVVLDGVHGIGKTTICRELGKRNGIKVLPEIKDVILPPPVLGPQSSDKLKSQLWFLRQMILKNEKITNGSIVVSDRGITSVLLYSKVLLDEYEFELVKTIVNSLN
ncbi:MAG: AAA family ATPase [Candidatus Aenigmarchaeota archaeon]|nr:AAA family ATPase [Candidatus Aenigmarchaeota archaeon]